MSLQDYTPWFNNPAPNPVQKPFSRTGPHQTEEVDDSPYGAHVAPVHPYDKEPMFEKPLTPSDVGKLNRLVIPKLQAEKYFPLGGGAVAGTLLGFKDEDGKEWLFRYSYWNSSQSYVLTKGWSRYVKEKRLETGDVVFFERNRADPERMFIGWRRPGSAPEPAGDFCYNSHGFMPYQYDSVHAPAVCAGAEEQETGGSSNSRRQVRLFGVNLECQLDNSPSSQTTSSGSSFFATQQQSYHYYFDHYNPHHM